MMVHGALPRPVVRTHFMMVTSRSIAVTISHGGGKSLYSVFDNQVRHLGSVVCVDTITMVRPAG
jgi:hypothetical protein